MLLILTTFSICTNYRRVITCWLAQRLAAKCIHSLMEVEIWVGWCFTFKKLRVGACCTREVSIRNNSWTKTIEIRITICLRDLQACEYRLPFAAWPRELLFSIEHWEEIGNQLAGKEWCAKKLWIAPTFMLPIPCHATIKVRFVQNSNWWTIRHDQQKGRRQVNLGLGYITNFYSDAYWFGMAPSWFC
jgi:hypothetical protein